MKIASFNINGIKARLPRLLEWLDSGAADVVALQEIKSMDDTFPRLEFEDRGWHVETHGQKSFNGVALLSRQPLEDVRRGLPPLDHTDPDDPQARYIEAITGGVRVASIYAPNGNPLDSEKFPYKLHWMDRLIAHGETLLAAEQPVVLAGDYNVIPTNEDCHDPPAWANDALFQPESRARLRTLLNQGWLDALRQRQPSGRAFTFWDYQGGAWQKDNGIRIDHLLLSPEAADHLVDCRVDRTPRGKQKASDHTPIIADLALDRA
ncbi:exodeoxyribonuclease III [Yunchengibacter salinarum]|uniref:exodeoxyribonuclease III n=1 Tax=Yunchengibacter salinarum TaxID=3133399 RepID=UPI0035B578BD